MAGLKPNASFSSGTRTFLAAPSARFGLVGLAGVLLCGLLPGRLAPAAPNEQQLLARFTPPATRTGDGTLAALGTDQLGRDILSRVIHGARTSVLIGMSAVLLAGPVGTRLGFTGRIRGGVSDYPLIRPADIQFAFSFLLLPLTLLGVLPAPLPHNLLVGG